MEILATVLGFLIVAIPTGLGFYIWHARQYHYRGCIPSDSEGSYYSEDDDWNPPTWWDNAVHFVMWEYELDH